MYNCGLSFKLPLISEVRRNLEFSFIIHVIFPASLIGLQRAIWLNFKVLSHNRSDWPEKVFNSALWVDLKVE